MKERTAQLQATSEEMSRLNEVMVGRELRMIELKKQVNELFARLGEPPPYALDFEKEPT